MQTDMNSGTLKDRQRDAAPVKSGGRILYWDILKGITILAMILGHTKGIPPMLRAFIFSVHMPLFFIANAYFIHSDNVGKTFRRSAKTLLRPYAVVCLLALIIDVQLNTENAFAVIKNRLMRMVGGMSKIGDIFTSLRSVWLVWFVCCLFVARMIYVLVRRVLRPVPEIIVLIIILALAAGGYMLGRQKYFLPWSLDVALVALIFMWYGHLIGRIRLTEHRFFPWIAAACGVIWIVLTVKGYWIEMATRSYKGGPLCILNAILGTTCLIWIAQLVGKIPGTVVKFLAWCGENSIIILAVHCLEMMWWNWSDDFTVGDGSSWYTWVLRFVLRAAVIIVVSGIYWGLKKLVKYLNTEDAEIKKAVEET